MDAMDQGKEGEPPMGNVQGDAVPGSTGAERTGAGSTGTGSTGQGATVAFCQQCGRGLTVATQRPIGSGIFCEPCAAVRQTAAASGYTPVAGPSAGLGALPPAVGEPNPVLAGFLGLIPGVGAMYNGQYPKGVIHLVIFVVLTSLADNLNWVLWWFVWGWIFYQAFEAYHTAQARRDGLPLPDPFGWNDLGDRLGFARTSAPGAPPSPSARQAGTYTGASAASRADSASASPADGNFYKAPATAPAGTATTSQYPSAPLYSQGPPNQQTPQADPSWTTTNLPVTPLSQPSTPWTGVPPQPTYAPTYTGVPSPAAAATPSPSLTGAARFPGGAAWLIGLGVLFLIGNIAPEWRLQARWLVPALLALLALWTGSRRLEAAGVFRQSSLPGVMPSSATLAEALLGPVLLLTVAVLLALQTAHIVWLRHSWPALLIVWGIMLLIGRARGMTAVAFQSAAAPDVGATSADHAPSSVQESVTR